MISNKHLLKEVWVVDLKLNLFRIKIKTAERHVLGVIICPVWQLLFAIKIWIAGTRNSVVYPFPLPGARGVGPGHWPVQSSVQCPLNWLSELRAAAVILVKI